MGYFPGLDPNPNSSNHDRDMILNYNYMLAHPDEKWRTAQFYNYVLHRVFGEGSIVAAERRTIGVEVAGPEPPDEREKATVDKLVSHWTHGTRPWLVLDLACQEKPPGAVSSRDEIDDNEVRVWRACDDIGDETAQNHVFGMSAVGPHVRFWKFINILDNRGIRRFRRLYGPEPGSEGLLQMYRDIGGPLGSEVFGAFRAIAGNPPIRWRAGNVF